MANDSITAYRKTAATVADWLLNVEVKSCPHCTNIEISYRMCSPEKARSSPSLSTFRGLRIFPLHERPARVQCGTRVLFRLRSDVAVAFEHLLADMAGQRPNGLFANHRVLG